VVYSVYEYTYLLLALTCGVQCGWVYLSSSCSYLWCTVCMSILIFFLLLPVVYSVYEYTYLLLALTCGVQCVWVYFGPSGGQHTLHCVWATHSSLCMSLCMSNTLCIVYEHVYEHHTLHCVWACVWATHSALCMGLCMSITLCIAYEHVYEHHTLHCVWACVWASHSALCMSMCMSNTLFIVYEQHTLHCVWACVWATHSSLCMSNTLCIVYEHVLLLRVLTANATASIPPHVTGLVTYASWIKPLPPCLRFVWQSHRHHCFLLLRCSI
jgi:hypothetical protein